MLITDKVLKSRLLEKILKTNKNKQFNRKINQQLNKPQWLGNVLKVSQPHL